MMREGSEDRGARDPFFFLSLRCSFGMLQNESASKSSETKAYYIERKS